MSTAKVYWHLPSSKDVHFWREFDNYQDARGSITSLSDDQYITIIKYNETFFRFIVTKGAGPMEVIPLHAEEYGVTEKKTIVSEIVKFLMYSENLPSAPGEFPEGEML